MECKSIIEIKQTKSDDRRCNCCHNKGNIMQELFLGYNNQSISICLCEQCLVILHDLIGEYLEDIANK